MEERTFIQVVEEAEAQSFMPQLFVLQSYFFNISKHASTKPFISGQQHCLKELHKRWLFLHTTYQNPERRYQLQGFIPPFFIPLPIPPSPIQEFCKSTSLPVPCHIHFDTSMRSAYNRGAGPVHREWAAVDIHPKHERGNQLAVGGGMTLITQSQNGPC